MTVKAFQKILKYVDYKHCSECVTESVELLQSDMLSGTSFYSLLLTVR